MNIGFKMSEVIKSIGKLIDKSVMEKGHELSMEYFIMLNILYDKDNIIQQDLASIMNKDKSAILRQIDVLERKKLVVRIPDSEDRRKKTIVLTKDGRKMVEKLRKIEADIFNSLLKNVSEKDLKIFESVLDIMKAQV
ncbi:MarR family transcriptional regulator [Salegentibacter sp. LM13S]|uniref:MarR family winged helix-turn-helix transcriptional regulator n=1 Tax=Salegentibacter lacus TaxID=2873599 RepID=UPI001CCB8BD7|nr:MarR family transcriptional regulator [Salegentibacter lacus]MBZ9631578.1 MarR family transcriptional regulator [Salegentibacter lacus]